MLQWLFRGRHQIQIQNISLSIYLTETSNYQFRFPYLEEALRHTLGKNTV
jgi:hypothetical protein